MIVCGSGHRLSGQYHGRTKRELRMFARVVLRRHDPDLVIAGGALGWDQALAWATLDLGLKLRLVLPFKGMENRWEPDMRAEFRKMVERADSTTYLGECFDPDLYQARNVQMVDESEAVLALWDGRHHGGTFNCLRYAQAEGRRVHQLWQEWDDWWPRRAREPETRSTG